PRKAGSMKCSATSPGRRPASRRKNHERRRPPHLDHHQTRIERLLRNRGSEVAAQFAFGDGPDVAGAVVHGFSSCLPVSDQVMWRNTSSSRPSSVWSSSTFQLSFTAVSATYRASAPFCECASG